eukprot:3364517-Pleurochrysis_carterae.AAC.1
MKHLASVKLRLNACCVHARTRARHGGAAKKPCRPLTCCAAAALYGANARALPCSCCNLGTNTQRLTQKV